MNYVTLKTFKMKFTLSILVVILVSCYGDQKNDSDTYLSGFIAELWLEGTDVMKIIWRDCSKKFVDLKDVIDHKEYYPKFVRCMKRKTLKALDRSLSRDVVPIAEGVNLVRFELVDHSGNILQENETKYSNITNSWSDKELEEGQFRNLFLQRMGGVLRTHVIKFDFEDDKIVDKVEFRGRRRHHMMTMMMFGIVSIGMVVIPMGFQFLAVLGGKALLLAKMALILASVQGLKKVDTYDGYHKSGKIAASPIGYGFYPSFPPYDHYDKRSHDDWQPPTIVSEQPYKLMKRTNNEADDFDTRNKAATMSNRKIEYKVENGYTIEGVNNQDARQYPVYTELTAPLELTVINQAQHLVDLTTRPGEVQADYSLDLPYNGFHFQSATPLVST